MRRRNFLQQAGMAMSMSLVRPMGLTAQKATPEANVRLPTFPTPTVFPEVVLFAFDDRAFPFRNHTELHLAPGHNPQLVLTHGAAGSVDDVLLYYGSVVRVGDTLHMWYNGNYGPLSNTIGYERVNCRICYATSRDGVHWEKPSLGLVTFGGSANNNIVDFLEPGLWSTFAVLYDPDDPNPSKRYKAAYEARLPNRPGIDANRPQFCVAFSPDGLHWKPYEKNPVGQFLEMAGVMKHDGLYYVNGQNSFDAFHPMPARRLATFASADFEHWSSCAALGLDRSSDLYGPSREDFGNQYEEVHLGAGIWNRGNVMIGLYGQWHASASGDRRGTVIDLGLAITHDALHYHEPISGFRIVPSAEQPGTPYGIAPALVQGQGMENLGDQTLYWYGIWRGTEGSGVRMVSWPRDRLGLLKPFNSRSAESITCPVEITNGSANVYVNASGLTNSSRLRVELLDEAFRSIDGYSGGDAAQFVEDGFRMKAVWKRGDSLLASQGRVRLRVLFEGEAVERCALHAIYIARASPGSL
jgi:hypothetical protein